MMMSIRVEANNSCDSCNGSGYVECASCNGRGGTDFAVESPNTGDFDSWTSCSPCSGSGQILCNRCGGSGST